MTWFSILKWVFEMKLFNKDKSMINLSSPLDFLTVKTLDTNWSEDFSIFEMAPVSKWFAIYCFNAWISSADEGLEMTGVLTGVF